MAAASESPERRPGQGAGHRQGQRFGRAHTYAYTQSFEGHEARYCLRVGMFRREVWTLPNECLRQTRVGASQASHALEIRAVWRRSRLVGARS